MASSGYAAVWATENTRAALWEAMKRKETYATTGTRMIVRFFGGWEFTTKDANTRVPAKAGYAKGVPMGGDLSQVPAGKAPTFLVAAMKDPMAATSIAFRSSRAGSTQRQGPGKGLRRRLVRRPQAQRRRPVPPVGNTVDVKNATWTNTIGDPELITVWTDPDFDPARRAFYYARVIEIPTPRWTAYEALRFGIEMPEGATMTTQERAYTSPIWYTPAKTQGKQKSRRRGRK